MFGLLSLLISIALAAYLWSMHTEVVVHKGNELHDQAEQISGRSKDGTPVGNSIVTEPENDPQGHFKDLLVKDVTAGGGLETFYGLHQGDRIISVESLTTMELPTGGDMKALLADAYQRSQPIMVIRAGQQVTLPLQGGAKPGAAAAPASGSPGGGSAAPAAGQGNSIQDLVNRTIKTPPQP
jgi:hypothetical protein